MFFKLSCGDMLNLNQIQSIPNFTESTPEEQKEERKLMGLVEVDMANGKTFHITYNDANQIRKLLSNSSK